MNYFVSLGPCGPTDCTMRLARGGVEARNYLIDTIPWKILALAYDQEGAVCLDVELGAWIWDTFNSDNYEDVSG